MNFEGLSVSDLTDAGLAKIPGLQEQCESMGYAFRLLRARYGVQPIIGIVEHLKTCAKYKAVAEEEHGKDGELEFDNDAVVSLSDGGGAYVQSWSWIEAHEAGLCPNEGCHQPVEEGEEHCKECLKEENENEEV